MSVQRGDVVMIDWPYSDRMGSKVRPAIVVQVDPLNVRIADTVLIAITGTTRRAGNVEVVIDPGTETGSGLWRTSVASCNNLMPRNEPTPSQALALDQGPARRRHPRRHRLAVLEAPRQSAAMGAFTATAARLGRPDRPALRARLDVSRPVLAPAAPRRRHSTVAAGFSAGVLHRPSRQVRPRQGVGAGAARRPDPAGRCLGRPGDVDRDL